MLAAALILHDVIYCYRSPQFRMPCSDWRKRVGVTALKGEKKNLDYPTKRTQLPLRRGWGMHAVRCVGLSPVFHLLQRQKPMHTHGCSVYRRQQTPQGARGFLPCVSLLADVAAGSDRAGAARAPVAARSQKSFSSIINASSLLA